MSQKDFFEIWSGEKDSFSPGLNRKRDRRRDRKTEILTEGEPDQQIVRNRKMERHKDRRRK